MRRSSIAQLRNFAIAKTTGGGAFLPPPAGKRIELRSMTGSETRSHTSTAAYAALLGPLASIDFSFPFTPPTLILICFGLASAFLGNAIFSTPLSYEAETDSVSTVVGRVKVRVKLPYWRSTRR